jgi:hypothetical protein
MSETNGNAPLDQIDGRLSAAEACPAATTSPQMTFTGIAANSFESAQWTDIRSWGSGSAKNHTHRVEQVDRHSDSGGSAGRSGFQLQ